MSQTWNEETRIEENTQRHENREEENYRQEIEDIVKGFIIEKDLLAQSHEEEINRIRVHFDKERKDLLQQLQMEKEQMIGVSRIMDSAANEVTFAVSDSFISEAGRIQSYSESGTDTQMLNGFHQGLFERKSLDETDSNLIREIAEVYLRVNNGSLTTQMRPDLDLEDKFEQEREAIESSFRSEKRELKRKMEEDCQLRLEQERLKYEGNMADMKTIISDLQWQKKDSENRVKHEREKLEMNFEREKTEIENRHMQSLHEVRRKLDEKHSNDLDKQRERYEENISDLQRDISKLTLQLQELNQSLAEEKETIMIKFERELKEMEQAFVEQRNSLKANFEAEFLVLLENETSVLKRLNVKLKEELEAKEKEKQDLNKKCKDDKRKLEEKFEEEISEMERRWSEEKRLIRMKLDDRYQLGLVREKGEMERTIHQLSEEINLLRQENSKMEIEFTKRKEELQRQLELERREMRGKLQNETEEVRTQVENEFSQKLMLEKASRDEVFRQFKRDELVLRAKCDDLEMKVFSLRQERDLLVRNKEQLDETLRSKELALMNTNMMTSAAEHDHSPKLEKVITEKEKELTAIKLENQHLELSMSAMRREKSDMQDEIANLKRRISSSSELYGVKSAGNNSELTSAQERIRTKESELQSLHQEKYELDSRLFSLQRKNEELEDELATLRRKKLDVEDEISALKRDKAYSDQKIASLSKEKGEMQHLVSSMKRKHADMEEEISTMKREKVQLEHELGILKRQNKTMEIEVYRQFHDQNTTQTSHYEHVTNEDITPQVIKEVNSSLYNDVESPSLEGEASEMERVVKDLKREKSDLENAIGRLINEKEDLEKDVRLQLEYRRKVLRQSTENSGNQRQVDTDATRVLQRQKNHLQTAISALKEQHAYLEVTVSQYERESRRMEERMEELNDDKIILENQIKSLKVEKQRTGKEIESSKKEKEDEGNIARRLKVSGIPCLKTEHAHGIEMLEQQVADLQEEREELRAEFTNLKKQHVILENELSAKNVFISNESVKLEEKEISELKKNRMNLERSFAVLRRKKTEMETEIAVIRETKEREENDLSNIRRERTDLDLQLTALQKQKTRLEADGSVLEHERKKDENEVHRLRREKVDLEKHVYDLQNEKRKLEAKISLGENACQCEATGIHKHVEDPGKHLEILQRQKEDVVFEMSSLEEIRDEEKEEIKLLLQQKSDMQLELSSLRKERLLQSQKSGIDADTPLHQNLHKGNANAQADLSASEMESLKRQKEEMQYEKSGIETKNNNRERELHILCAQKSDMEALISGDLKTEIHEPRKERDRIQDSLCDEQSAEHRLVSSERIQQDYLTQSHECSRQQSPGNFHPVEDISFSSSHHPAFSSNIHPKNTLRSSQIPRGTLKEDNEVTSLKREREEIVGQISDMRVQLAKLQTEVAHLECKKTILEALQHSHISNVLETETAIRNACGHDVELDSETKTPALEVMCSLKINSIFYHEKIQFIRPITFLEFLVPLLSHYAFFWRA